MRPKKKKNKSALTDDNNCRPCDTTEPSAKNQLPAGWESVRLRDTGKTYYINVVTSGLSYKVPKYPTLPPDWKFGFSEEKNRYYFISPEGETTFTAP